MRRTSQTSLTALAVACAFAANPAYAQVTGDTGRVPVAAGEHVTLSVTGDVADEEHVHGYDLDAEVQVYSNETGATYWAEAEAPIGVAPLGEPNAARSSGCRS